MISLVIRQMKDPLSLVSTTTTTTTNTTIKRTDTATTTTRASTKTRLFNRKSVPEKKYFGCIDHFSYFHPTTPIQSGVAAPHPPALSRETVSRRLSSGGAASIETTPDDAMTPMILSAARLFHLSPVFSAPAPRISTLWTLGRDQRKQSLLLALLCFLSHLSNHISSAQQLLFEPNPDLTVGQSWSEGHTPQPNGYTRGPSRCYDDQGKAQRCVPPFVNAAFNQLVEATNTCGNPPIEYCRQTGVTGTRSFLNQKKGGVSRDVKGWDDRCLYLG